MESTLAISKDELAQAVGVFCGYGRGVLGSEIAWTTRQQNKIDDCLKSGVRQFYWPPSPDGGMPHSWSFLKPIASITLVSGEREIELPDDFGGAEEGPTLVAGTGVPERRLTLTNSARIREMFARDAAATGPPQLVAIVPLKGTEIDRGQRFALSVYPIADADYPMELAYSILSDALSSSRPYVYGGALHAETVLESCLAIAEQRIFDAQGVHTVKFHELLKVSIDADKKFQPIAPGYNADRSDLRDQIYGPGIRHRDDLGLVTRDLT